MIEDFTNPHGEMKPISVEKDPEYDYTGKLRVIRIQGLYIVQRLFGVNSWANVFDDRTGKDNQFQTLQEAENLIKRIRMPYEVYYY